MEPNPLIAQLRAERANLITKLEKRLQGRDSKARVSKAEVMAVDRIKELNTRICDLESEDMRGLGGKGFQELRSRVYPNGAPTTGVSMPDTGNVYAKRGRNNYLSDLARVSLQMDGTGEAARRLRGHAEDMQRRAQFNDFEQRDLSRTDGYGGYFSPPAWLIDQYVEFARPGRPLADILDKRPLPGGVDVVNVPKILTGTATSVQTADNQQVTEVDLTDTYVSSPIRTIAGQQSISLQLIDQSPIDFSNVILEDLASAHAVNLDSQVLYGTGTSGQITGLSNTPGISTVAAPTVDIQGIYTALANGYQQIVASRFRPPTHVVMHPRRWAWLLQLLDDEKRPLFVPRAGNPFNAAGTYDTLEAEGPVGEVLGLPIILDSNISTLSGTEYSGYGTEDNVYILRSPDVTLYESGIRARVSPETLQQTLTVLITLWSYYAIGVRFPGSVCEITGLTAPVFT
ncbi:MAG: phage major capsid protein [Mycobacterium sp.]